MDYENKLDQLEIIEKKEEKEGKVDKALNTLFDTYFTLLENKKKVINLEFIINKIMDKKGIYFYFDEIGNIISSEKEKRIKDIPDTHEQLIIEEIRKLLNIIVLTSGLQAIVAGINDLESFMSKKKYAWNIIRYVNLPTLLNQIKLILKFELYRNSKSNLRTHLKEIYPKECNKEKQDELEEKMNQLIEKLYENTAGHYYLLKRPLRNLMKRDKLESIDNNLMKDICYSTKTTKLYFLAYLMEM